MRRKLWGRIWAQTNGISNRATNRIKKKEKEEEEDEEEEKEEEEEEEKEDTIWRRRERGLALWWWRVHKGRSTMVSRPGEGPF